MRFETTARWRNPESMNRHAWEQAETGGPSAIHMQGAPSQAEALYKQFKEKKEKLAGQNKQNIMEKYGDAEFGQGASGRFGARTNGTVRRVRSSRASHQGCGKSSGEESLRRGCVFAKPHDGVGIVLGSRSVGVTRAVRAS